MKYCHLISDSPRKIQVKVNLLRSQRDRLENQIANVVTISITAQQVVDQKDAEIRALQKRQQENDERARKQKK